MTRFLHVTSSENRDSIKRHGLDWTRMGAVRGIAGSSVPEQNGIFLCEGEEEADWFVRMNAPGGLVDVWSVEGVEASELVESLPEHEFFLPRPIPPSQLTLVRQDIEPAPDEPDEEIAGSGDWTGYQPLG